MLMRKLTGAKSFAPAHTLYHPPPHTVYCSAWIMRYGSPRIIPADDSATLLHICLCFCGTIYLSRVFVCFHVFEGNPLKSIEGGLIHRRGVRGSQHPVVQTSQKEDKLGAAALK